MINSRAFLAQISSEPVDPALVEAVVAGPEHGAVVLFTGVVRNHDGGKAVSALDYRAHPDAPRFLERCCTRVAAESGLQVAAVHRIGELAVGDIALAAAVAAPHRAAAFTTCATLVDRIKTEVPIWKRQMFAEGISAWVGV